MDDPLNTTKTTMNINYNQRLDIHRRVRKCTEKVDRRETIQKR